MLPLSGAGVHSANLISPAQVAMGAALVLVNACISVYLALGMEIALAVATIRSDTIISYYSPQRGSAQ